MAKLKGPLFSLGASQQIGKALVYFGWKGLNVVREYVIPSNPKTALQTTQRGHMTYAVQYIHDTQAELASPWTDADAAAYALWASVVQASTTWFNQAVRHIIDRRILGLQIRIFRGRLITYPASGEIHISITCSGSAGATGRIVYGTSKTSMVNSKAATIVAGSVTCTITGLTNGVKYYMQYQALTAAAYLGLRSGIYYGTPHA